MARLFRCLLFVVGLSILSVGCTKTEDTTPPKGYEIPKIEPGRSGDDSGIAKPKK